MLGSNERVLETQRHLLDMADTDPVDGALLGRRQGRFERNRPSLQDADRNGDDDMGTIERRAVGGLHNDLRGVALPIVDANPSDEAQSSNASGGGQSGMVQWAVWYSLGVPARCRSRTTVGVQAICSKTCMFC